MDVHHVKPEEQIRDTVAMIQQMGKFPDFYEFPQPLVNPVHEASFYPYSAAEAVAEQKQASMAAMREMIYRIAAMQPIHIDPESVKPPKRRNVKISKDPQSVAARQRREKISERIRILQRIVPGGTKMDTASMLDEAIHYVKFLKKQVQSLEVAAVKAADSAAGVGFPATEWIEFCSGRKRCESGATVEGNKDV